MQRPKSILKKYEKALWKINVDSSNYKEIHFSEE